MERGELIRPLIEETHWTHAMLGGFFAWMHFFFHSL